MHPFLINPLSVSGQGAQFSAGLSFFAVIGYILLFFGILALAYFSTRLVGSAYDRSRSESKIRVVDRRLLSQDKSILVVKIADLHYVLYTDRNRTLLLDKLEQYELEPIRQPETSFQAVLNRLITFKKDSNS
jgi:flagellar biogenesis protein FliO